MIKDMTLLRKKNAVVDSAKNLRKRKLTEKIAFSFVWLAGLVAIAALLFIVGYVVSNGIKVVDLEFLTTRPCGRCLGRRRDFHHHCDNALSDCPYHCHCCTAWELARQYLWWNTPRSLTNSKKIFVHLINLVRTSVEILAGVPSIIFGLIRIHGLCLVYEIKIFPPLCRFKRRLPDPAGYYPHHRRGHPDRPQILPGRQPGIGHYKMANSIYGVVLPAAMPGIITGIVLSVGRVIAETAVFWVTLGGSYRLPKNLLSSGRSMALHVYMLASETRAFDKALGTSAILIIIIIGLNLAINITSRQFSKKFSGK